MPIYEYACTDCGGREERLEPLAAALAHDCPSCGIQGGMRRQLSVAAFTMAGAPASANPTGGGCGSGGGCPFA